MTEAPVTGKTCGRGCWRPSIPSHYIRVRASAACGEGLCGVLMYAFDP